MTDTIPRETPPDTPPAKSTAKPTKVTQPKRTDRKPRSGSRKKSLKKPLEDLITNVGTGVAILNQPDGIAIIEGAESLAAALNNVARDNDTVYRNLERMLTGSAWGAVFMALGSIALPIAANHNLLPFQIPGMEPPQTPPSGPVGVVPDIGGSGV